MEETKAVEEIAVDEVSAHVIRRALEVLRENRPGDRSEKDRYYAVVITDIEKACAYFHQFVVRDR